MAELKTKVSDASVPDYIATFPEESQRDDARALCKIMTSLSGKPPRRWGTSMIGFDTYHYTYASGQEFDWPVLAFALRKKHLTIYLMPGFKDTTYLKKLGKFKLSGSCLHVKRLSDLHLPTLKAILKASQVSLKKFLAERKKKLANK